MLTPWIKLEHGPYIRYDRFMYGEVINYYGSYAFVDNVKNCGIPSNYIYLNMKEYATIEGMILAVDNKLIELGYILLTENHLKILELLF